MRDTEVRQTELLEQGKYVDAVIDMIRQREGVTFVEIEKLLSPYMEVNGDYALYSNSYPTLIFWMGISEQYFEVMKQVMSSGKVEGLPTHYLTYYADGKVPTMPLARKVMQYKDPHWVPIAFNSVKAKEKHKVTRGKKVLGKK